MKYPYHEVIDDLKHLLNLLQNDAKKKNFLTLNFYMS